MTTNESEPLTTGLNTPRMTNFRLPSNLDIRLREYLASQRIGVQHFFTAVVEHALQYADDRDVARSVSFIAIEERAREIKEALKGEHLGRKTGSHNKE